MIAGNVNNAVEMSKTKKVKCYGIFLEQHPIGFSVICDNLLYSFGININCRQPQIKAVWFNWLKRIFKNNFVVVLYRSNTRAINYFIKNGLEEFCTDGEVVYLIN